MLVLTRKADQWIILQNAAGEPIAKIKTLSFGRDTVKLGFEAGPEVVILRAELEGKDPRCGAKNK